jgi:sigma-B regulation protein RsbU (phosphoserine phosphatase)
MGAEKNGLLPLLSYRSVLDQLSEGIFIADASLRILYCNREGARMAGLAQAELLGGSCRDALPVVDPLRDGLPIWEREPSPLTRILASGESESYPHLLFLRTRSAPPLPVAVSLGPVHDAEGRIVGALCRLSDRSEEFRQRRLAGEIQKRMVSSGSLERGRLRVETLFKPVEELGGDFLEAFLMHDGTLIATVADAVGHGVSASLFSMIYKALLHAAFADARKPQEVLERVNRGFCSTVSIEGFYLSAVLVCLDPEAATGCTASAGHPAGLLFHPSGKGHRLRKVLQARTPMLGMSEQACFPPTSLRLESGEFLLLASDGLFEAEGADGRPYGVEGLERFFAASGGSLEQLYEDLLGCSHAASLKDDLSALRISCR